MRLTSLASVVLCLSLACSSGGSTGTPGAGGSGTGGGGAAGTTGSGGSEGGTAGDGGGAGSGGSAAGTAGTTGGAGGSAGTVGTAGSGGSRGGATGTGGRGGATAGSGGSTGTAGRGGSSGGTGGSSAGAGGSGTGGGSCPAGATPSLKLTMVASGFARAVDVRQPVGDNARLFVVEQSGRIRIARGGQTLATPFLDFTSSVFAPSGDGAEKGFLGLAFHPNYSDANNGRFFVFYNRSTGDPFSTGGEGDVVVAEGHRSSNADVADPTLKALFVVRHHRDSHTGGALVFGPDGLLYLSIGDNGDGDAAASPTTKWGKILRVDVGSGPPATPNLDPAVVHYGLRNPWRFSFDRMTGDMLIGDVGQDLREEIDRSAAGQTGLNYGWPTVEGAICVSAGCSMTGFTAPIYDYGRSQGRAVIGGFVYRGQAIPCMQGRYFFADYDFGGPIFSFVYAGASPATGFINHTSQLNPNGGITYFSSIGQDNAGELYLVGLSNGNIYRLDAR